MKVKYIKDIEYDAFMIWIMLSSSDPAGTENRAKSMNIDKEAYLKISTVDDFQDIKDYVIDLAKERYREHKEEIRKAIVGYQKAWDKINNSFSKKVGEITQHKWYHDEFFVVVSPFHPGVSNNGGDTVIRFAFEDFEDQRRITAHEILMSHIWSVMFDRYGEKAKQNPYMHYWGLNEITTVAVLGLEPEVNALWAPKYQGYDNYLTNYTQLKELQFEMKEMYLAKKSFLDFLDDGISIIEQRYSKTSFM